MYRHARGEKLPFYETARGVRRAAASGRLVRLRPEADFDLGDVGFPYVRAATRTFVRRLGAQYRAACGEPLVVTSATRPATRQPANSVAHSVHPTGMAVDLRKPFGGCLRWLRTTLLQLEGAGVLEATEEFGPPHFHVAVYPTPYARYVAARTRRAVVAAASPPGATTGTTTGTTTGAIYRVRPGDTLWEIARAHDTTVERIRAANALDDATLQPGQALAIPADGLDRGSAGDGSPQ
jgi:hypothetical protein